VISAQSGGTPGLYGGTQDNSTCSPEGMIAFLEQETDHGRAWAEVQGIDPSQLRAYISRLTPAFLPGDTRVTNHGFRDGRATAFQAVLQAGTAVLVDDRGMPRARCACGNPLTPPTPVAAAPVYTGQAWPGFRPEAVTTIAPARQALDALVLTDIDTGETFRRPVGTDGGADGPVDSTPATTSAPTTAPPTTAPRTTSSPTTTPTTAPATTLPTLTVPTGIELGSGDFQATLLWQGDADMDLHVIDPNGDAISFATPSSPSGGTLDLDEIPSCGSTETHVENVFWPAGDAPAGEYTVFASYFAGCSSSAAEVSVQLTISADGVPVQQHTFTIPVDGESPRVAVRL
jgi:hypothetical protein